MLVRLKNAGRLSNPLAETFSYYLNATEAPAPALTLVESEEVYDRDALICYTGKFETMDGPVTVSAADLRRVYEGHNARLARIAASRGGVDWDPGDLPPVQVDHTESGWDTVGRVHGYVRLGEYTPVGESKARVALYGRLRFLGKENCARARDGRWANISIGADFDAGILNEVTATPFAAAPEARLLPEANLPQPSRLAAAPQNNDDKGSGGTGMDKEKLRKHLMAKTKCSEKDADERLAKMSDDEMKKLSAEKDEDDKKLAAADKEEADKKLAADKKEEDDKRLAAEKKEEDDKKLAAEKADKDKDEDETKAHAKKMSAARTGFIRLSKGIRKDFKETGHESKKVRLAARLHGLRAKAAITPAEIKRYDVNDLATKSDEAIEAFFLGFENREPVIPVGSYGSAKAASVAQLTSRARVDSMLAESASNMPFTGKAVGEKLGIKPQGSRLAAGGSEGGGNSGPLPLRTDVEAEFTEVTKLLDSGDRKAALARLKGCITTASTAELSAGDPLPDTEKRLSALAEKHRSLENQFEELVGMVAPILGVEAAELSA